ncbi:MAG: hypothetical protein ACE3L7_05875 [Candidatus Pristimantibacillus sp.]
MGRNATEWGGMRWNGVESGENWRKGKEMCENWWKVAVYSGMRWNGWGGHFGLECA